MYVMLSILLSILVCVTATERFPLLNSIVIKDCKKIIKRYVKEPEDMMCMTLMKQLSRLDVRNYNVQEQSRNVSSSCKSGIYLE